MKHFKTKGFRAVVALAVVFSLVVGLGGNGAIFTYAAEFVYAKGTVNVSSLNLRDKPDNYSNSKILVSMARGTVFHITDQKQEGIKTWYYGYATINDKTYTGWAYGPYMDVVFETIDNDYANSLRDKGFPESYIPYLCGLHGNYPAWEFEPVQTNLDWEFVIQKESRHKENLVPNSYNDSRKSTASDAYSYYTNKWVIVDGGSWVDAHPDYIRYCMDPRNFMNSTNIFMFECSSYNPSQTVAGVEAILKGTWMASETVEELELTAGKDGHILTVGEAKGTVSFSQAIYDACKINGLNPYQVATRLRQEQGVNKGPMMQGQYPGYEGYYNAFNFGASGTTDDDVKRSGLQFAKNRGWDTPYKAIFGGASRLVNGYVSVGQDTLYLQKFHVYQNNITDSSELFWHQYMQNVTAPYSEGLSLGRGYTDKQQAFVFKIPVYKNMPGKACTFTDTGNPNNYLSSLSASGIALSPVFDGAKEKYTATVPYNISQTIISASAVAGTSTVKGTGTVQLKEGKNVFSVTCTAQNGAVKKYEIEITRSEKTEQDKPEYTSNVYSLTPIIRGINPGTTTANFLKTFTVKNCEAKVLNYDGTVNNGVVGTGNRLVIVQGKETIASYDLIVYGDVNGDGNINIIDLGMIDRYILKAYTISGINLEAADCNHDGNVNIIDLGMIDRHILKAYTISQ